MKNKFEMSMVSELTFFLGLEIRQLNDEIFLFQSKYAKELVKKFDLESTKHSKTFMNIITNFSKGTSRKDVKQMLYRSMIGSLFYLIESCLDIFSSVEACARYQANPKVTLNYC